MPVSVVGERPAVALVLSEFFRARPPGLFEIELPNGCRLLLNRQTSDIVDKIFDGLTDQGLMLETLERPLPAAWDEPRSLLTAEAARPGALASLCALSRCRAPRSIGDPMISP